MADPHAAAPELKRLRWLLRGAFLWALVIFCRLAWLQTYAHEHLQEMADRQQEADFELQPPRGEIATRDGVFLAVSVPAWTIIVDPRKLDDQEAVEAVALLSRALHLDARKLDADLSKARKAHRGYLRVKAKANQSEYQTLKTWVENENKKTPSQEDDVDWLAFRQESWRGYPNAELGASLVGAVDSKEKGYLGIELSQESDLRGTPGWGRMLKDSRSRYVNALEIHEPVPGKRITLTIHAQIQSIADRAIADAVRAKHFESGTIVVMNPNNGEVYAMSAFPSFDPNAKARTAEEANSRVHRAISQALDGGSVMKMFTVAGALEYTDLRPTSMIEAGPFYYSARDKIQDHHTGMLSIEKGVWVSSNGVAIRVGKRLGPKLLYRTLRDFGFGQKTGIELPGESAGVLWPLENPKKPKLQWQPTSHYFISIGHEIGLTTIQLAQACSVIANGGYRVKPKLVLSKQAEGGEVEWVPESPKVRVIKAETAADMRTMSEGVVLKGTGTKAHIVGRTVGGKTGTAQMRDKRGRYVTIYSSSFMGYAPLNTPKIVVVVTLNGGKLYGGDAAAPVFASVTDAALNLLGEPGDVPMNPAPAPAGNLLASAQSPAPVDLPVAVAEALQETPDDVVSTGGAVPDLSGLDKRAVARIAAERGLPIQMTGAGLVRAQSPPAGSVLALGAAVHVRFAR